MPGRPCATGRPSSAATVRSTSSMAQLQSANLLFPNGLAPLSRPVPAVSSRLYLPVRKPPASGLQGMTAIPASWATGTCSRSMSRATNEYSTCSAIGPGTRRSPRDRGRLHRQPGRYVREGEVADLTGPDQIAQRPARSPRPGSRRPRYASSRDRRNRCRAASATLSNARWMFLAPAPPALGLPGDPCDAASGLAEALKANLVASTIWSRVSVSAMNRPTISSLAPPE